MRAPHTHVRDYSFFFFSPCSLSLVKRKGNSSGRRRFVGEEEGPIKKKEGYGDRGSRRWLAGWVVEAARRCRRGTWVHERGRWGHRSGAGDPESGVGGTGEMKKRGRGNVVSPGPFSWPAPAARRVIASPGQASRVRPLLHTIPLAPLLLSSPLLSSPRCLVLDRAPPCCRCSLYSYPAARVPSIPDHHAFSSTAMHTARCAARAVRFFITAATRSGCSRDRAPSICFSPLVALPQIALAFVSSYN